MSDFDPFDPAPNDEAEQLQSLKMALRRAQGFALFLVRCNDPAQRRDIIAALHADRPDAVLKSIELREPIRHLLDELQNSLTKPNPNAVLVGGLEYSLPDSKNAANSPVVANLNAARNSFPRVMSCPLVLFVPEYALVAIMRGAPDFYSVRSGLYFFARTPEASLEVAQILLKDEWVDVDKLVLEEKRTRIREIENLLEDVNSLAFHSQHHIIQFSLLTRLGNIYQAIGDWNMAEKSHAKALAVAQETNNRQMESQVLNNLGIAYRVQGKWKQAEDSLLRDLEISHESENYSDLSKTFSNLGSVYYSQGKWKDAEKAFNRSLSLAKASNDLVGEAQTLGNLGALYLQCELYSQSEVALQESLRMKRLTGDRATQSQTLNNLGLVYGQQSQWERAEEIYQEGLTICLEVGDRLTEAQILNNLVTLYQQLGRWKNAEEACYRGLKIKRELGDTIGQAVSLGNLAALRRNEGDITSAFELMRQCVSLLETTEDTRTTELAKEFLGQIEEQMSKNPIES